MSFIISPASLHDIPDLEKLVNSAYRGEAARSGWTHEADLIEGDRRTDATELGSLMSAPDAVFLVCKEGGQLLGSVYLEKQKQDLYLGMLSVDPAKQDRGIGKALVKASETYALEQHCRAIVMTVISVRKELIDWYQRLGYRDTGERKPFPTGQPFGDPRMPLEFIVMRKSVRREA